MLIKDRLRIRQFIDRRCAVIVALVFSICFCSATGCGNGEIKNVGYSVADKQSHDECEAAQPEKDLYAELIQSNQQQQLLESLTRKLERLKGFVRTYIRGGSETPMRDTPPWVNNSFAATGLDWNGFSSRFSDDSTTIDRWQINDRAASFSGANAFGEFIDDSFAIWGKSNGFLLDLKPYSTKWLDDQLETRLVAEIYGQTEDGLGQQATAIWVTRWQVGS